MRAFAVLRIARLVEVAQALKRVGHQQQRPAAVMPDAAEDVLGRRAQVDDMAARLQEGAGRLAHAGAAAGGQHRRRPQAELIQRVLLDVAKARLALALEELADRAAKPPSITWSESMKGRPAAGRAGARQWICLNRAGRRGRWSREQRSSGHKSRWPGLDMMPGHWQKFMSQVATEGNPSDHRNIPAMPAHSNERHGERR